MVYCWSCGAERHESPGPCTRCGAVHASPVGATSRPLATCGGCGYSGEGTRYFTRAGHAFLLGLVTLVTYGIGGFVYWVLRRNALVCPACGLSWERANALPGSRVGPVPAARRPSMGPPSPPRPALPLGGLGRRIAGIVLIVVSVGLLALGIVSGEPVLAIFASMGGLLGAGAYVWGRQASAARRDALLRSLQGRVIRSAYLHDGALTVTDVASELGLTLDGAERLLCSMDDGFRVRSDVTRDGVIIYRFPEIVARSRPAPRGTLESAITGPEAVEVLGLGRRSAAS